jgi:hypothetical protein
MSMRVSKDIIVPHIVENHTVFVSQLSREMQALSVQNIDSERWI